MSIYNRPYMRYEPGGGAPAGGLAVKRLIITLAVVYVLQNVLFFWVGTVAVQRALSLSLENLGRGYLHSLLSYGFLHGGLGGMPWHLLFNCLMLFFFGRTVESSLGGRRFTEAFLLSVVGGGLIWLGVRFLSFPQAYLIGASAGVYGIIAISLLQVWRQQIQLWLLPFVLEGRHLFWFFFGVSAFLFLFGELDGTSVAHSAHLGGMLSGWLYHRWLAHRPPLSDPAFWARTVRQEPPWARQKEAVRSRGAGRFKVNLSSAPKRKNLRAEVDRILDKINAEGFGALTDDEKQTLDRAKEDLR